MGPGHLGVGFAVKPLVPKAPLWTLLVASEALDLLCFGFFALRMESNGAVEIDMAHGMRVLTTGTIPWSHSLVMSIAWSVLAAGIAYLTMHDRRISAAIGLVVFSHWLLDLIVHISDLPIFFDNSPKFGLGLWGSGPGFIVSIFLDFGLCLIGGIAVYSLWKRKKDAKSRLGNAL